MKLKFLDKLADIVVSIDEGKNITDENVVSTTDSGIRLIAHMKLIGLPRPYGLAMTAYE